MRTRSVWMLAVAMVTVVVAWAQPPADVAAKVGAANSRFAFDLLSQLTEGQTDNVFVSPFSIALALEMTANGAAGDTQAAMLTALEAQGLSPADLNQASQSLLKALTSTDPQVQLAIANALWLQKDETFVPAFVKAVEGFYGAKASLVDFASPTSNAAIDAWVKLATNGNIPAIAGPEPFDKDTLCILTDAVYFHGQWTASFDPAKTAKAPFALLDGTKTDVPMMTQSGKFEYLKRPGMQMIRLPYGAGRLAMYVILPGEMIGFADASKAVTADNWNNWASSMVSTPGKIVLPRFRIDYGTDLKPALAAMGMDLAFDQSGKADFSNLCTGVRGPVFIANVLHKTLLDVNEQGTTAAAATAVEIEGRGMPADQPEPFEMIVNRPFFCAIMDRDTGTILFLGSIVNPQAIPAPVAVPTVVPPTTGGAAPQQQQPVRRQRRGFTRPGPPQRNGPQGGNQPPHP